MQGQRLKDLIEYNGIKTSENIIFAGTTNFSGTISIKQLIDEDAIDEISVVEWKFDDNDQMIVSVWYDTDGEFYDANYEDFEEMACQWQAEKNISDYMASYRQAMEDAGHRESDFC